MKNPKTTILGWIAFGSALLAAAKALLDGDPATIPDFSTLGTAFFTAIALTFAKDETK